ARLPGERPAAPAKLKRLPYLSAPTAFQLDKCFPSAEDERGDPPPEGARRMKIAQLNALLVRIPQKPPIAPYQSRYRATSAKEALLVRLETDTSLVGWGETPVDWIHKSFEGAPEELLRSRALGRDPFDLETWYAAANDLGPFLASAAEMALW